MLEFRNDYSLGAHPKVLEKLQAINERSFAGYGEDEISLRVRDSLREKLGQPQAAVHFLSGGTQANLTVIAALLRPYQGVVAADTGHIAVHETGAVEATGHKVLTLPCPDGKLQPEAVEQLILAQKNDGAFEHMVQPGMAYVSNTTELGTIYQKAELAALREVLQRHGLPLYLDGARLGYALASEGNDMDLKDIAALGDLFTIGLTKQGALFGEALVIVNPALQKDFRYNIKQRGGMLAKGWLMAAQFEALMEDGLYLRLSKQAVDLAMRLKQGLQQLGLPLLSDSPSNQQFPILPNAVLPALEEQVAFNHIAPVDDTHTAVRFCTSWATRPEEVEELLEALRGALPC